MSTEERGGQMTITMRNKNVHETIWKVLCSYFQHMKGIRESCMCSDSLEYKYHARMKRLYEQQYLGIRKVLDALGIEKSPYERAFLRLHSLSCKQGINTLRHDF